MTDLVSPTLSIALETNGRGYIGYLVALPGAFIRGQTADMALGKTAAEVLAYCRWREVTPPSPIRYRVVHEFRSAAAVEEADSTILLEAERRPLTEGEFAELSDLMTLSATSFESLCRRARFPDWVDAARVGATFYGPRPSTIAEIGRHVLQTQFYYLSRLQPAEPVVAGEVMAIRRLAVDRLTRLFRRQNNVYAVDRDGESWTLRKVLRRFVWHDRIHAKAIVKLLRRQAAAGLIGAYDDPFRFGI